MLPRPAFTIVELLVVITIIVLLLALLMPAIDRAIYQAELAVCASHLDAIAGGAIAYAAEHRRQYPRRSATVNVFPPHYLHARGIPDERRVIEPYIPLNAALNDPLSKAVDIAGSDPQTDVYVSYLLMYGWQYRLGAGREKGLFRLGDAFEWQNERFTLLAGDQSGHAQTSGAWGHGSHPDRGDAWFNDVWQDQVPSWRRAIDRPVTVSWWYNASAPRGTLDLNFAHGDGSVRRWNDVAFEEGEPGRQDRMSLVPFFSDGAAAPLRQLQVPRR